MKVTDLTITDWQKWLDRFYAANPNAKPRASMRIENTIFSPARRFGGMTMNGDQYTYFEPVDDTQPPFSDGGLRIAWLMVRMDFLRWVTGELKKESASVPAYAQEELL